MHLKNGVYATTKFLEMFFDNLLMGTKHELKNRYMHVDYVEVNVDAESQSAMDKIPKCKNCTLNCTLEEREILRCIKENPAITQNEIAERMGKSERTIKSKVSSLQQKGYISRVNGKRYGHWEVLVDISGR